jgi:hypothetical protein
MSDATPSTHEIAIYIEDCDECAILTALSESLGDYERVASSTGDGIAWRFYRFAGAQLMLAVSEPGFSECWLRGELPWADDVAFARAMASRLGRRVFCDPGAHCPDVHPLSDAFLLIDAEGERIVNIDQIEGAESR